jgi:hypothetical protein
MYKCEYIEVIFHTKSLIGHIYTTWIKYRHDLVQEADIVCIKDKIYIAYICVLLFFTTVMFTFASNLNCYIFFLIILLNNNIFNTLINLY